MLNILKNINLKSYTTLKIGEKASFLAIIKNENDLYSAIDFAQEKDLPILILGGGSNVLISRPLKALVLKNEIKGIEVIKESQNFVYIESASGEWWSSLVDFSINNNWGGIENLYYVPGTVGAAPIQNIGAYGAELKDVFVSLRALDLKTKKIKVFSKKDCQFAYRDSIFKRKFKNRYFILSIIIKLSKQAKLNLNYGDIKLKLTEKGIKEPSVKQLAHVIREIRDSKLPNPAVLANAGSFFKNPEIKKSHFLKLKKDYPNIKSFPSLKPSLVKVPAAWLIDQAGFKGKRFGPVGMYKKQALILVNYNQAKAKDVLNLVDKIKKVIFNKFKIRLETEVIIF
jgi:UDP-N-acetylmuramate dehydrogenase